MRERLAVTLETAGALHRNTTELMRQMQQTFRDMQSVRERLRGRQAPLGLPPRPRPEERLAEKYQLTPRELEVALLLAGGASNAFISETLSISEHTARHHTRHVLVKLGLHSRARATALIARELGGAAPALP